MPRHMQAAPAPFLKAMAPYREDLGVCVEGLFTWDGLADLGAHAGIPFGLGHALAMKASHGGTAQNDQIDAHQMAVWRRGGLLPQASVDPAAMRATRARLRRRMPRRRQRAALLAHIQPTHSPSHLPELGKPLAAQANRAGVAERCPDPAVQQSRAVDRARMGHDDRLLMDRERSLVQTAQADDAPTFSRLRTIPGVGQILALVLLYAIPDSQRCPRVQAVVSSGRLITWAQASAGTRDGPSGKTIGKADLKWAFAAAAGLGLRQNPAGQQSLARVARRHGKGNAVTVLAHTLARAVDAMFKRDPAFALDKVLHD